MKHLSEQFVKEMEQKLLSEKKRLEEDLSSFAKKDTYERDDFDTKFPDFGDTQEDNAAEVADYDSNLSVEHNLESQLKDIDEALDRIKKGTFGICLKTGKEIKEERLRVLPSAKYALEDND